MQAILNGQSIGSKFIAALSGCQGQALLDNGRGMVIFSALNLTIADIISRYHIVNKHLTRTGKVIAL
jgi:hypothetical protein